MRIVETAAGNRRSAGAAHLRGSAPGREAVPPGGPARPMVRRAVTAWDVAGIATLVSLTLAVHLSRVLTRETGMGHSGLVRAAALGWIGATITLLAALAWHGRPTPRDFVTQLVAVWRDPPGDWVAFLLGCAVALPLLGMYAPILLSDADSARIVAAVNNVQDHGIGFLRETQDNLLPHLVLGPALAVRGLAGVKFVAVMSVVGCVGVIAYIARRATGSMAAAAATAVSLLALSPVVERAGVLPMYGAMLALGYGGGWLAYRALTDGSARLACAIGAGACLALAPEAQPVGVLFLPVPLFLLVFSVRWRHSVRTLAVVYGTIAVVSLPRLALNLSVGGTERLTSYRTDYWITKGYVSEIQQRFWGYAGVNEPLGEYLTRLPERLVDSLGGFGWAVLALAAVSWFGCSRRARWFVLIVVGYFLLAITAKQVPPFPRYYSPMWPGIALLVGAGVASLARRRATVPRLALVGGAVALVLMAASSARSVIDVYELRRQDVMAQPYAGFAALITDGQGVIGARSHALLNVTAEIPTYGGQFLSEEEYVTYLTWPSDAEVLSVMSDHDIGWVLIHTKRILETGYHNTWLIPHYHQRARQVERVFQSPNFCLVAESNGYALFRVGPCPAPPT